MSNVRASNSSSTLRTLSRGRSCWCCKAAARAATHWHIGAVLERKPWIGEFDPLSGVILHEQIEVMPEAAE